MRLLRHFYPILLIALLLAPAAMGADRVVLMESFTNTSCPYCPDDNAEIALVVADYGTTEPIQMINVQYHVWWPSSADPFYVADIADNTAATAFYGVNAVPDIRTDGADEPSSTSYNNLVDAMESRLEVPSPFTIDVTHTLGEDCQISVEASVTAVAAVPASGLVLRMALVEEFTHYDTAPGSNGQTDFYCSMREMLPDFNGTPLTISNGQTQVVSLSTEINPKWNMIYAVVWVQDTNTKEVLQAARSWPDDLSYWEDYSLSYTAGKSADFVEVGATSPLTSLLTNDGDFADTYDVHLDKSGLPLGWEASVCIGAICYPPFVTDFVVPLDVLATMEILVDITPTSAGLGSATISVSGRGNPCASRGEIEFTAVTPGPDVLLVDADGGSAYESYYEQALTAAGKTYVHWDLGAWGRLTGDQLAFFDTVIWYTAKTYGSGVVNADDRAAIAAYLDDGGRLFMSGQLIGYSTYNYGGAEGEEWHQTYLGAEYVKYDTFINAVGVAGDPVSDGLAFDIVGGDGANNQTYPSKIDAYGDGVACILYGDQPQPTGGTRLNTGTFKSVYFAFSFEAIAAQADRELVMSRVLDYLELDGSSVPQNDLGKAYMAAAPQPSPNPFNPSTRIKFELGGSQPGQVKIDVFDVRGCLVRSLFEGTILPGPQSFEWDGRNNLGAEASSGSYLGLVTLDGVKFQTKMVLAK